jgi:hypothetical protein
MATPPVFRTPQCKTFPAPILSAPRIGRCGSGDCAEKAKKKVKFDSVYIREHARLHDGSGGIPDVSTHVHFPPPTFPALALNTTTQSGAFPLGLGWEYEEFLGGTPRPLDEHEKERQALRSPVGVQPLSEVQRKKLLEASDAGVPRSTIHLRAEMAKIRRSRSKSAGCGCSPASLRCCCAAGSCQCFRLGMPCIEGVCSCIACCNPHKRPGTATSEDDDGDESLESSDEEEEDDQMIISNNRRRWRRRY